MERLTQRDVRALLEFLEKIYRLANFRGFVGTLLTALPLLVPAELVAFCDMNPDRHLSKNWTNPAGIMTPACDEAWRQHMGEHPVLTHNVRTRDGRAVRFADFLTQRQHQQLGLYNEFYRAIGMEDGLCMALAVPLPRVIGVALHRGRWSFTERERLLMNLARPHLVAAWRNAKAVSRLQGALEMSTKSLEMADVGIVVLDHGSRVRFATRRAREMIETFYGSLSDRRLPAGLARWVRDQQGPLRPTEVLPPREPLRVEGSGKRLTVRLIPATDRAWLLLDQEATEIAPTSLTRLGLTRREAEVLAWVAQGKTNPEIALILGASVRTVHKHLEHIFVKLRVETRTAAAVIAVQAQEVADD